MEEVKVKAKYIPIAPQKVRLITDLLKYKKATDALSYLKFETKYASVPVIKLVKSAIAAAESKNLSAEKLIIKEIRVDAGPIRKKQRIRAKGRADLQKKRTSHILITLIEEETKKEKPKKIKLEKDRLSKNKTVKKKGK